jgi:hypothetical protein
MGIDAFRTRVDEAFQRLRTVFNGQDLAVLGDIQKNFAPPHYVEKSQESYFDALDSDAGFREWVERNVSPHKHPSYASVTISLKGHGDTPGDATSDQMRAIADVAERLCPRRASDQSRAKYCAAPCGARGPTSHLPNLEDDWFIDCQHWSHIRHYCLSRYGLLRTGDSQINSNCSGYCSAVRESGS